MPTIDLSERYMKMVLDVLARFPGALVWAYGSRVSGGNHEGSDLDLVVRSGAAACDLREAFIESDLPILVDVLDWGAIPEGFKREIEKNYIPLGSG